MKNTECRRNERLNEANINNQGCLMKIIEYENCRNIIVEFQDEYKARVHTDYRAFKNGGVKNPYHPTVYGVGVIGNKYPRSINGKHTKEYDVWVSMLARCYSKKKKEKQPTYRDVSCCSEWFLYDNFYEWLHKQKNYKKWSNNKHWHLDKDIIVKGNKIYSPKTCCLVPENVNALFIKRESCRGELPIGVTKWQNKFYAHCDNPFAKKVDYLGAHDTQLEAFRVYKEYKEGIIKQVAQIEYDKNNIIKECYDAMMNYEVRITD